MDDERLRSRLEALYLQDGAIAPADAAASILAEQLPALGADVGFIATLAEDGATVQVKRVTPFSRLPVELSFGIDAPYPLAAVLRDGDARFIESNEQLRCDHPGLVRVDPQDHACATLSLRDADGALLGALNVGFEDPHAFTDEERTQLRTLAATCAEILASNGP